MAVTGRPDVQTTDRQNISPTRTCWLRPVNVAMKRPVKTNDRDTGTVAMNLIGPQAVLRPSQVYSAVSACVRMNSTRIVLSEQDYRALLRVSRQVGWRFHLALVLTHETGHRIGAIRQLRWSDIDWAGSTTRWRSEQEKTGYEQRTPVTVAVLEVLELAHQHNPEIGDAPLVSAPKNPSVCVSLDHV